MQLRVYLWLALAAAAIDAQPLHASDADASVAMSGSAVTAAPVADSLVPATAVTGTAAASAAVTGTAATDTAATTAADAAASQSVSTSSGSDPEAGPACLLNPTPASQERPFDTDRPTKSNIPYTVPCGHFQYETDIFNYSYQYVGDDRIDTLLVPNPTLKLGVAPDADVELNIAPYESVVTEERHTGRSTTVSGPGDLYARVKFNLWGDDHGDTSLALLPYVKAPVAPLGVGNGETEGGLIVPLSISLPAGLTLLTVPEIDVLKDAQTSAHHANYADLVNLSRSLPLHANVTAYLEYWADANVDPTGTTHQYSLDASVAWQPHNDLQFDVGINAGLNRATPAYQFYLGAAQRF
ncbi:MAG TPA: transporter [Steroidobacteraceae bacterium]|nr:transporter [Steroidobacteraceae bacterium]